MGSARLLTAIGILALGLWADIHVDLPGQFAIGAVVWALFLALLAPLPAAERRLYLACVAIATAGELFLSLGWGLYTYRLGNVPLFVPPGHALMLMLGFSLTRRMPEAAARAILGGAGVYTLLAAVTGLDTLAVPLYLMLAVSVLSLPAHTRAVRQLLRADADAGTLRHRARQLVLGPRGALGRPRHHQSAGDRGRVLLHAARPCYWIHVFIQGQKFTSHGHAMIAGSRT